MAICSVADPVSLQSQSVHPLKSNAKVLLCSVFGPYAQDDEYGSRAINPMELYHNQVTRVQGGFSLRMFHQSWGLLLMQANMKASCTLLDFPLLDRFVQEIRDNQYDIIGISAIPVNVGKVTKMCQLIREYAPGARIVVGGHVANMNDIETLIDADHIVRGDGVRWFRAFLGEDENQPIRHPQIYAGIGRRTMGVTIPFSTSTASATLIPSVGCPMGCNFCSTSAMYGGKGKFVNFYQTGDELFDIMCQLEKAMKVQSFFVMDENFLLHRERALRLLELMQQNGKIWALYIFSSANALNMYTMEQLVGLGVSLVWVGLEGEASQYGKLDGTDTRTLVRTLQANGIRVLGSTIIGLENHTPENIDDAIAFAVSHDTDFHQFMLYTAVHGTPLRAELEAKGLMVPTSELAEADTHGQYRFNYRHPSIKPGQDTEFLLRAFQQDFDVNGPSIFRLARTALLGWKKYKNHPDPRIRARFAWEMEGMGTVFAGALWGARQWYRRHDPKVAGKINAILQDVHAEFGLKSRLAAPAIGLFMHLMFKREQRRLARGWTFEPPTIYQSNCEGQPRVNQAPEVGEPVPTAPELALAVQPIQGPQ